MNIMASKHFIDGRAASLHCIALHCKKDTVRNEVC